MYVASIDCFSGESSLNTSCLCLFFFFFLSANVWSLTKHSPCHGHLLTRRHLLFAARYPHPLPVTEPHFQLGGLGALSPGVGSVPGTDYDRLTPVTVDHQPGKMMCSRIIGAQQKKSFHSFSRTLEYSRTFSRLDHVKMWSVGCCNRLTPWKELHCGGS